MPLKQGSSDEAVSANIHELIASGYPHSQAIAIALHTAGRGRKQKPKHSTSDTATHSAK